MNYQEIKNKYSKKRRKLSEDAFKDLLMSLFNCSLESLLTRSDFETIETNIDTYLDKLIEGVPLAYVLHEWTFDSLRLYIEPGVLIPRPETEELIQLVMELGLINSETTSIIDVGCGSGAISLALKNRLSKVIITAVDLYPIPLMVTRINSISLQLPLIIMKSDLLSQISTDEKFDLIISNPPYITDEEMKSLDCSVTNYEPSSALNGGADGLSYFKRLVNEGIPHLKNSGFMAFELSPTVINDACNFLASIDVIKSVRVIKDINSKERFLIIKI